jgi:ABC-type uncharacterized transport system permease subunit
MPLVKLNRDPSSKDLRWFGLLFALFLGLAGFLSWRKTGMHGTAPAFWIAGSVVPLLYYAIPPLRRPIYVGWMYLMYPVGTVVSYLVLAAAYFLVFTPVGLILRLSGKDLLLLRREPKAVSYWSERRTGHDPQRYFSQY